MGFKSSINHYNFHIYVYFGTHKFVFFGTHKFNQKNRLIGILVQSFGYYGSIFWAYFDYLQHFLAHSR